MSILVDQTDILTPEIGCFVLLLLVFDDLTSLEPSTATGGACGGLNGFGGQDGRGNGGLLATPRGEGERVNGWRKRCSLTFEKTTKNCG